MTHGRQPQRGLGAGAEAAEEAKAGGTVATQRAPYRWLVRDRLLTLTQP